MSFYKLNINTNQILVVKIQHCLDKLLSTFKQFSFKCHFTNSLQKSIMPSKPTILRRKYSDETLEIILAFCEVGKLYTQIANQVKVSKLSVIDIIHQATCIQN